MILYFSATGNSQYTAKKIAQTIGDETLDLFEKLRHNDFSELRSGSPWVVVAPTYAWRIPRIVQGWLAHTSLAGNKAIYFVMTCAGGIGNAGKYLQKLSAAKGLQYKGCMQVIMPENYIALFSSPSPTEASEIIRRAGGTIDKAALLIKGGESFPPPAVTHTGKLSSGIVNNVFYPLYVHANKFYATGACISCGKCVRVCPLGNVRLESGRPVWGNHCTHCMACINRCPSQAIEYGKHTRGLTRYTFPDNMQE